MTSPEEYVKEMKESVEKGKWCVEAPDGVHCFQTPSELADWARNIAEEQK